MPTYEYVCIECDISVEKIKSFSEAESSESCEKCGNKMNKVYGTFGINLKGPGFYSTDNRK
jgi:putative FmdB family regulatory protein